MNTNIYIGKIIQEEVFKLNYSLHELSELLRIDEKKIIDFFELKSIDLRTLYRWSCILKVDFFVIYTEYLLKYKLTIEDEMHNDFFQIIFYDEL